VGSGIDSAELLRNGAFVTGLDFSPHAIKNSRQLFKEANLQGDVVLSDATSIPFKDSEFDVVYSYGVVHHIPNVLGVLSEVKRVLRPGGSFLGMVYNRDSLLYAYSIVYLRGVREGLLTRGTTELELSSNFSERHAGNLYTKLYTIESLTEMLREFFDHVEVRTHYDVIDTPLRRKIKFKLEDNATNLGWHLVFKAT
jgi:SAM-dependent methyltransferase